MKRTKQIIETFQPKQTLSSQAIVDIVRELVEAIEDLNKRVGPGQPEKFDPSSRTISRSQGVFPRY